MYVRMLVKFIMFWISLRAKFQIWFSKKYLCELGMISRKNNVTELNQTNGTTQMHVRAYFITIIATISEINFLHP